MSELFQLGEKPRVGAELLQERENGDCAHLAHWSSVQIKCSATTLAYQIRKRQLVTCKKTSAKECMNVMSYLYAILKLHADGLFKDP